MEHCFTDDEFTVIDPFLELINVELTNENKTIYSLYSSIMGFIFTFILYYFRFMYSPTKSLSTDIIKNIHIINSE